MCPQKVQDTTIQLHVMVVTHDFVYMYILTKINFVFTTIKGLEQDPQAIYM